MKLLFVDCCISQRGKDSRTLALAKAYIDAFRAAHPDWEVERADVAAMDLPPLTAEFLDDRDTRKGEFSAPMFAATRNSTVAKLARTAVRSWCSQSVGK